MNRHLFPGLLCLICSFVHAQSWRTYYDSTQIFLAKQDWQKALALLHVAERDAMHTLGRLDENYHAILSDLGVAHWKLKDYESAEHFFNETIKLKEELPDSARHISLPNTYWLMALLYHEKREVNKARFFFKKILFNPFTTPARQTLSDDQFYKAAQSLIALYEENNELDSALYFWKLAEVQAPESPNSDVLVYAEWMLTNARLNRESKNYEEALAMASAIKMLLGSDDRLKHSLPYCRAVYERGLNQLLLGDGTTAESEFQEAWKSIKPLYNKDRTLAHAVLKSLIELYNEQNFPTLNYYDELVSVCQENAGVNEFPCHALKKETASVYVRYGDISAAIRLYEEVLHGYRSTLEESDPLFIETLNALAEAYYKNKQHHKAYVYLRWAAEQLSPENIDTNLAADVFANLARVYSFKDDLQNAAEFFGRAYTIKSNVFGYNSPVLADLSKDLALTYWVLNDTEKAISWFKQSLSLLAKKSKYIYPILTEREQSAFYGKVKEDLDAFNSVALSLADQHPEVLVQVFEFQAWLNTLRFFVSEHNENIIRQSNDPALIKTYSSLVQKCRRLKDAYHLPEQSVLSQRLETEIALLEDSIALKTGKRFLVDFPRQEDTYRKVHSKLGEDEALITIVRTNRFVRVKAAQVSEASHYRFDDGISYAFLIAASERYFPQLVLQHEGKAMETVHFDNYKDGVVLGLNDGQSYFVYWQPFESLIREKERIYILPQGVYHSINLNTLKDPRTDEYVIERYALFNLLRAEQLIKEKTVEEKALKDAVLLGDINSLPGEKTEFASRLKINLTGKKTADNELYKIERVLRNDAWETRVHLKNSASEKRMKSLQSPVILHIAMPVFFSEDETLKDQRHLLLQTGLAMAEAEKAPRTAGVESSNNGWLTAYEIMSLNLKATRLVVLSGSQAMMNHLRNGEESSVLQQAFEKAGAASVLTTLWKTNESSHQHIIEKLYENLSMGVSPIFALREAQLMEMKTNRHPYHWGVFMISGVD